MKKTMALFGVLGASIVALGVLYVSLSAADMKTQTASQAYLVDDPYDRAGEITAEEARRVHTNNANSTSDILRERALGTNPTQSGTTNTSGNTGDSQSTSDVLRDKAIREAQERKNGSSTNTGGSSDNSGSNSGSSRPRSTTPSYPSTPMACREYELLQTYMRNNVSYVRTVPIVNGKEVWSSAGGYWSNLDLNKNPGFMPGSGDVQAYHGQINPITSVFTQYVVRGSTIYTKSVATNKGMIDWKKEAETQWFTTKLAPAFGFPQDGWITAYGEYFTVTGDATKTLRYFQYLKRDAKSYANDTMSFTYVNNQLQLDKTVGGKFNMVADLRANPSALPGSGEIVAQGDYVNPFLNVLRQDWVRGDVRYKRDVPIENGVPNFAKAGAPVAVQEISKVVQNVLPGSGPMQTLTSYFICKSI